MIGIAALVGASGGAVAMASPAPTDSDQVRALVAEMVADAESRSSLLQTGGTAGHDGHFFLSSADGNFTMMMTGQLQTRYTLNINDEDAPRDDEVYGFNTPRTALRWEGQVFGDFGYAVQGNFDRAGGAFTLEDAYMHTDLGDGLLLIWGQLRMPVLWENMLYEKYSLAADRSVMGAVFGQGRSQGIWLHDSNEEFRWWAGFSDGLNSANTDFGASPADWALTGRFEYKLFGEWSQFEQFSSASGSEDALKLAIAAHAQDGPDTAVSDGTELFAYTADAQYAGDGWNAFASFVGLSTDVDGVGDFDDFGWLVQGGVFVAEDWELFGRFDMIIADSSRANDDDFSTFTFGANHYIHGQAAKFTVDVSYYLDDTDGNDLVSGIAPNNSLGLLPSGEEDQFVLRAQFQLLF